VAGGFSGPPSPWSYKRETREKWARPPVSGHAGLPDAVLHRLQQLRRSLAQALGFEGDEP